MMTPFRLTASIAGMIAIKGIVSQDTAGVHNPLAQVGVELRLGHQPVATRGDHVNCFVKHLESLCLALQRAKLPGSQTYFRYR
jgi:hypothetical protein